MPDNTSEDRELELRDYLAVLRRRKGVIAAAVILAVGLAFVASSLQTRTYRASSEVLLQQRASEQIFAPSDEASQRADRKARIDTEIQVMKSESVESAVVEALGRGAKVSISPRGDTDVVAISATSTQPRDAARIANTYAETYIKTRRQQAIDDLLAAADQVQAKVAEIDSQVRDLQSQSDADASVAAQRQALLGQRGTYSQQLSQLQLARNLTGSGGAQLVSRAVAPGRPFRPTPTRDAATGGLLGLIVGVGLAFARDHLDETLRSKEEVEAVSGLTVLGAVPKFGRKGTDETIASLDSPSSGSAEAYRSLRTSIQFLGLNSPTRAIQFTSALASEGKTTTVANLGVALASVGKRVLLVDCDLRRPRLHRLLGVDNSIGLTTVVLGDATLAKAAHETKVPNLQVLPSGPLPPNASEFLASPRVQELFASLTTSWDVVLIDTPPVAPVSDALVVAGYVDATILVVREKQVTTRALRHTLDALSLVEAHLAGAILNGSNAEGGYGYGGGYAYAPSQDSTSSDTPDNRRSRDRPRSRIRAMTRQSDA